jgi:hypothetical protein
VKEGVRHTTAPRIVLETGAQRLSSVRSRCIDVNGLVTATADFSQVGHTAVRYEDSTASYAPVVFYDDFWVQTVGMTVGMFVKIPQVRQAVLEHDVYAADKRSSAGSLPSGDPPLCGADYHS